MNNAPIPAETNALAEKILGAAIEVHRELGPGLLESIYESALIHELQARGLRVGRQVDVDVNYKGFIVGHLRLDLLVEGTVIVEVKAVDRHEPVFEAQVLSYLKLTKCRLGLLLNFNTRLLKDGIKRLAL